MSDDVKPATDADIDRIVERVGADWLREKMPFTLALIARIRADAARIARLADATTRLLDALDGMHAGGETFAARVSLAAFTARSALDGRDG